MSVARILDRKGYRVVTIGADANIKDVLRELTEHHVGVLVMINASNKAIGIVSERDVVRELNKDYDAWQKTASEIMTSLLVKCHPDDTESMIMDRMGKANVRHLPVEYGDKLIGLVSARDVLALRIEKLTELMQEVGLAAAETKGP